MFGGKQLYAFVYYTPITWTGAADKCSFYIPFRCRPIRAGITTTTVLSGAATVAFDRQPYAGAATDRGDGDCGNIVVPTTTAAGYVIYDETDYKADATGTWIQHLDEGDCVVVQLVSAASSGAGIPWLVVEIDPEQPGNNSAMTETA